MNSNLVNKELRTLNNQDNHSKLNKLNKHNNKPINNNFLNPISYQPNYSKKLLPNHKSNKCNNN